MKFAMLASGSKGNCFVVIHRGFQLVIDCGTSKRYIDNCLKELGSSIDQSDALLITHDHSDHIKALSAFEAIPTFAPVSLNHPHCYLIRQECPFQLGPFEIYPMALSHDSGATCGYILEADGEKLVYVTDTGYLRQDSIERMKDADYYVLESNHDVEMLMNTSRPYYLKQRILGDEGHLNNVDAAKILEECLSEKTKDILLAHCSDQANTEELAFVTTNDLLQQTHPEWMSHIHLEVCAPRKIIKGGCWNEQESMDCSFSRATLLESISHS